MVTFDHTFVYQFALFLDEQTEPSADGVNILGARMSRSVEGAARNLGLKFGHPITEQAVVMQGTGSFAPTSTLTWRAGSGVWRLVWTVSRIDLHFDARGYAEVTETELVTLSDARKRVAANLADVPTLLGQRVNRLALIVTGQANGPRPGEPGPSDLVAATFFSNELRDAVKSGAVTDVIGRANHLIEWDLHQGTAVRVNRNETGTSTRAVRNGVEETNLLWQYDVNTFPANVSTLKFGSDAILTFFERAESWISERLSALQEVK